MNRFLIVRFDGAYVARQGSEHSYTKDLKQARRFATSSEAVADCCDNEHVSTVEKELES